jgi:copper transport protein
VRAPGRRPLLLLAFALTLGLLTAVVQGGRPRAEAHALLARADPPVNSQLREAPAVLTLYFTENLERRFSDVRVTDQNRQRVDDGVEFDDADRALMRVKLKPVTPGYLTVAWENVSAVDGHRITGSYPLTILNPDGSIPPGRPSSADVDVTGADAKPPRVINRFVMLLAVSVLTGALAFMVFVTPALPGEPGEVARGALDRWALVIAGVAWAVLVPAGGNELLLQAHDVGVSVSDVINTQWGERWQLRQAVLIAPLCAIVLSFVLLEARRILAVFGLFGCAAYLGLGATVSHAGAGAGTFWAVTSDFVHLVAAAVWVGLMALVVVLFLWVRKDLQRGERYGVLATGLQRFSAIAVLSVALLMFTGTVNAVIEVANLGDMLNSGYGLTLTVKLLLLVPLLLIGAVNAYVLRPRLVNASMARGRGRPATLADMETRLGRNVRYELVAAALVLAIAGLLGQQTPTRGRLSDPDQTPGKFVDEKTAEGISATLVIEPNQPGVNTFSVYLTGAVDQVESVRLDFTPPGGGEEARLIMDPSNPPTFYVGSGPYLNSEGKWRVAVDLRRTRGSDLLLPFSPVVTNPGATAVTTSRSGGTFEAPLSPSPLTALLVVGSLAGSAALIYVSYRPREVTGGYASIVASAVSRRFVAANIRPAWSLGGLLIAGVGLGLLIGSHVHSRLSSEEAITGNPVEATEASVEQGRMIFMRSCVQCHGESGKGDGPLAASLPLRPANLYDHVPYHPDQFFFSVITNGLSGVMPAFGNSLSETERWHVLNFLRQMFGQPPATR